MITVQVPKGFSSGESLPDSDGWVPWNGGECPVPDGTQVEVEWRVGGISRIGAKFLYWEWNKYDPKTDIIRYRIVPQPTLEDEVNKGTTDPTLSSDGWIPWTGGECPVPEDTLVEVRLRGEVVEEYAKGFAANLWWTHEEEYPEADIVAYRVLPQYGPKDVAFGPRSTQVGGTHYAEMKIQPWDAINVWSTPEMVLGYHVNTAVSYLARFRAKGGLQDIKKAHHHLSELIRYFEEVEEYPF